MGSTMRRREPFGEVSIQIFFGRFVGVKLKVLWFLFANKMVDGFRDVMDDRRPIFAMDEELCSLFLERAMNQKVNVIVTFLRMMVCEIDRDRMTAYALGMVIIPVDFCECVFEEKLSEGFHSSGVSQCFELFGK